MHGLDFLYGHRICVNNYLMGMEMDEEVKGWSRNIAKNYNDDVDTELYSQLIDACRLLKINVDEMDRRYQFFTPGDKINYKDVIYLLGL